MHGQTIGGLELRIYICSFEMKPCFVWILLDSFVYFQRWIIMSLCFVMFHEKKEMVLIRLDSILSSESSHSLLYKSCHVKEEKIFKVQSVIRLEVFLHLFLSSTTPTLQTKSNMNVSMFPHFQNLWLVLEFEILLFSFLWESVIYSGIFCELDEVTWLFSFIDWWGWEYGKHSRWIF